MNRIDDPRLVFYMRHQNLIEEWAAVADDVRRAAIDFYESLADDLEGVASNLGDEVEVWRREGTWGQVGLHKPSWHTDKDNPRVAIALEWYRKNCSFVGGNLTVGVWVNPQAPGGKELSAALRERTRNQPGHARFPSSSAIWPAYRETPHAQGDHWWEDLAPYRQQLVAAITECWGSLADDIDAVANAL